MPSPIKPADILASVASLTASLCDKLKQFLLLPSTLAAWWSYTYNSDGTFTAAFKADLAAAVLPTGSVIWWPANNIPADWVLCNGQELDRTTYAALFSVIGTTWGTPSDASKFKVPDARGRVLVGSDGSTFTFANPVGESTVILTESQIPAHVHPFTPEVSGDASPFSLTRLTAGNSSQTFGDGSYQTDSAGGGAAHTNVQPSLPGHCIIRT